MSATTELLKIVNFNEMVDEMSNRILIALLEEGGLKNTVHVYLSTVIKMTKGGLI